MNQPDYVRQGERRHGAFIYARFSTENQNADTIEVQIDKCMEYCREHGLTVLGVYPDEAVSGMKLSRPNYDRMMADLRAGMADTVVVYDQSRLFRNMNGWFTARRELGSMGVRVVSCTQEYVGGDLRDPTTFILESNTAIINQMWVLMTRQKVIEKMRHMAKNGLWTGGKPALGYKVVEGRLELEPEEAKTVRRIFREYAAGKSYREIIAGLNADGIKTKRGGAFGSNSLHDLLKNELYTGTRIYGSKVYRADGTRNTHSPEGQNAIRIEDAVPAIIDKETFREVQRRMAQNKRQQGGRPASARDYPLKGKIFCGICGSAMTVAASKKGQHTYYYYRCTKKDRTHDCDSRPIRCDELERTVVEQVRALIGCPANREKALNYLRAETDKITKTGAEKFARLKNELTNVEQKISRIIDAIADGNYVPAMKQRLQELQTEKETIEYNLQSVRRSAEVAQLPSAQMEALFEKVCTASKDDDATIFSIVSRVEVYDEYIKIYTSFDPDPDKTKRPPETEEVILTQGTPSGVPKKNNPNLFFVRDGFGLLLYLEDYHG